jgi:hypothetical protein
VATAEDRSIADEQRTLIEYLLRERVSLRGISGLFSKRTKNNANAAVPQSVTRRFACI